jgi:hypothetical protein
MEERIEIAGVVHSVYRQCNVHTAPPHSSHLIPNCCRRNLFWTWFLFGAEAFLRVWKYKAERGNSGRTLNYVKAITWRPPATTGYSGSRGGEERSAVATVGDSPCTSMIYTKQVWIGRSYLVLVSCGSGRGGMDAICRWQGETEGESWRRGG